MAAEHIAWLNGRYVPLERASLSVLDTGVTSGVTATERLRTFRHEPFLLEAHVDRLAASADAAFIPLPLTPDEIETLAREVVARNAELIPREDDLAVSIFATAGVDGRPSLCIHASAIPAYLYADAYTNGVRLVTPPTRAIPSESLPPGIKTRSRLHWHIADAQAGQAEPGARALLLDGEGFVTETSTGNLFVVSAGGQRIATPRRIKTLDGISQAFMIELLGGKVNEADLRPEDVTAAGEAFVTSSVYCVLPVTRLNQSPIGDGPGPVYARLLRDWSGRVGVDIAEQMRRMARGEWER